MKKIYKPVLVHEKHPIELLEGKFGPHKGKIVCKLCNTFVKWASQSEIQIYRKYSQKKI